ncbi:MAG: NrtA/SsuA/CpmA family ABC transporter substrate-binding protein, partial [Bacteroidales bacterium]|nr:NrtA/SsuA/CpmA family ABC transporter substrate-binding protein [Bacteroidales bacterium]
ACVITIFNSCNTSRETNPINFAAFELYLSGLVVAASEIENPDSQKTCIEEAGLNCTIIKRAKGPDMVDVLIGGSADFGTLANTPVVFQALQGNTIVIFATMMTTNKDIKIVGHKNSGVNSGADLKGKKVGFVGGTIGEIFLDRYLKKYNLNKEDINLISAGPASLRDYFLANELDAIFIWEPTVQDILMDKSVKKNEIFIDVDTALYTLSMHLVATPEKLKKYRHEAAILIEALICAEKKIYDSPEEVRLQVEKWLDRKENTLIDVFDKNSFKLQLNVPVLLQELEDETIWAQQAVFKGKGTIPTEYNQFIDYSILDSIAPNRVIK